MNDSFSIGKFILQSPAYPRRLTKRVLSLASRSSYSHGSPAVSMPRIRTGGRGMDREGIRLRGTRPRTTGERRAVGREKHRDEVDALTMRYELEVVSRIRTWNDFQKLTTRILCARGRGSFHHAFNFLGENPTVFQVPDNPNFS